VIPGEVRLSIPAGPAPDFGLALLNRGVPRATPLDFPFFAMTEVSVLGPGRYSTTVTMPTGEVGHALTLDFEVEILEAILALAPPRVRRVVERRLAED